jgi:hypothetical protein
VAFVAAMSDSFCCGCSGCCGSCRVSAIVADMVDVVDLPSGCRVAAEWLPSGCHGG